MTTLRFTVEPGHVLAYCRATGEEPPGVGDDVPFAFPCCLRQQDPDHMRDALPSGPMASVADSAGTVMLASDRFEYLGRVRVGHTYDVVERRGEVWSRTSKSGAVLDFSEHVGEWTDEASRLVLRTTRVLVVVR